MPPRKDYMNLHALRAALLPWLRRLRSLAPSATLDLRALALCRMALGLTSLVDLWELWGFRLAWLSDTSICPPNRRRLSGTVFFDIFLMAESDEAMALLLLLDAVALVCFTVGFHTGLAGTVSWVFARSQQVRFIGCVGFGFDDLRNGLLFWAAFFAPTADVWSVDAWLAHAPLHATAGAGLGCGEGVARRWSRGAQGRRRWGAVAPKEHAEEEAERLDAAAPEPDEATDEGDWAGAGLRAPAFAWSVPAQLAVLYVSTGWWKSDGRDWQKGLAVEQVLYMMSFNNPYMPFVAELLRPWSGLCWLLTRATLILEKWGVLVAFLPSQVLRLLTTLLFVGLHIGMHVCIQTGGFHYTAISGWLSVLPTCAMDFIESSLPPTLRTFALQTHPVRRQPLQGLRRWAHVMRSVLAALLMLSLFGTNCKALGEKCAFAWLADPPVASKKVLDFGGLRDRWKMFAPNVSRLDFWVTVAGAVNGTNGRPKRVVLWEDGAPTFSGVALRDWPADWPAPLPPTMPYAVHRWRKFFEENNWKNHKVDFGRYLCTNWKKHRKERLIGAWTMISKRFVNAQVSIGAENIFTAAVHWCDKASEKEMGALPKPRWLTKETLRPEVKWGDIKSSLPTGPLFALFILGCWAVPLGLLVVFRRRLAQAVLRGLPAAGGGRQHSV
mmetsp:Transcript_56640/g.184252  ORF Transcript_56640/g.184252 Transcript_56640/m.184252 type:complete len:666 (-) Transcript_56640:31-2028(-)